MKQVNTIPEYIEQFTQNVQEILQNILVATKSAVPAATETIRYGIPTLQINGKNLLHFGAYKEHVSFYPTPRGIGKFKELLGQHVTGKGTARYLVTEKIPYDLFAKIAIYLEKQII